jgi:hypothetical protein
MRSDELLEMLVAGDLRTTGAVNRAVEIVLEDPTLFGELILAISDEKRGLALRAADAAEKVSRIQPALLSGYREEIYGFATSASAIEIQWHAAQMIGRLSLDSAEATFAFGLLSELYRGSSSRISRVCALESLAALSLSHPELRPRADVLLGEALGSPIPSVAARARKLAKKMI